MCSLLNIFVYLFVCKRMGALVQLLELMLCDLGVTGLSHEINLL